MTYEEIFMRRAILSNIPLVFEGRKLGKSEVASVMLMRVAYNKKTEEFNKCMEDVLKGLKKEGFDERAQAIAAMEDVDRRKKAAEEWKEGDKDEAGKPIEKPAMPTEEELKKAEETRKTKDDHDKELAELNENYSEARKKKLEESTTIANGTFTRSEYAEICELIGSEGTIELFGFADEAVKVARAEFLAMIATHLVA